jgi:hydroxymethylpyrimidine/phosphomethylpyrimidine kinase
MVVTPNIPEAELLTGMTIDSESAMQHAAEAILAMGCQAVLLKGGHGAGDEVMDLLCAQDGRVPFHHPRIPTQHTHGTGCTLASAITAFLAKGVELEPAVRAALDYVQQAILNAPGLGKGHGPLEHRVAPAH